MIEAHTPYDFLPRLMGPETWSGPPCEGDAEHIWVSLGAKYSSWPDCQLPWRSIGRHESIRCAMCGLYATEFWYVKRMSAPYALVRVAETCDYRLASPQGLRCGEPGRVKGEHITGPVRPHGPGSFQVTYSCGKHT